MHIDASRLKTHVKSELIFVDCHERQTFFKKTIFKYLGQYPFDGNFPKIITRSFGAAVFDLGDWHVVIGLLVDLAMSIKKQSNNSEWLRCATLHYQCCHSRGTVSRHEY